MTTYNAASLDNTAVDQLQDLLTINVDSQKGFQEAAEATTDTDLKSLFNEFSQKRAHNAAELRQFIAASGQEPKSGGSMSGALHRWWIDAKQALSGKDATSILNEAERGEDSIKHEYESILKKATNSSVQEIVQRQYRNVSEGHDRVKALRDAYRARNNPRD